MQVTDISWAPYSSTVFALVTGDGGVRVFDLHINRYKQICKQVQSALTLDTAIVMEIDFQKIITSSDGGLNRIAFNTEEPVLVVGDTAGTIHSLKLSPNLRKKTKEIIRAAQQGSERDVRSSLSKT